MVESTSISPSHQNSGKSTMDLPLFSTAFLMAFFTFGERWLYMEIQVMEYSLYKSFLVYEETDGHIHVNLIFRLKFFPLGLKF